MERTAVRRRLNWQIGTVEGLVTETPRTRSIRLAVPGWPGHRPGQHVDVRLAAEDGYQAQRSYSIVMIPDLVALDLPALVAKAGRLPRHRGDPGHQPDPVPAGAEADRHPAGLPRR